MTNEIHIANHVLACSFEVEVRSLSISISMGCHLITI